LHRGKLVAEASQFGETGGNFELFGGRGGREDSDLGARTKGFGFARSGDGFGALDFESLVRPK
jgi:hypothetical protein